MASNLEQFLRKTHCVKSENQLTTIVEKFSKYGVSNIKDLSLLSEKDWESLSLNDIKDKVQSCLEKMKETKRRKLCNFHATLERKHSSDAILQSVNDVNVETKNVKYARGYSSDALLQNSNFETKNSNLNINCRPSTDSQSELGSQIDSNIDSNVDLNVIPSRKSKLSSDSSSNVDLNVIPSRKSKLSPDSQSESNSNLKSNIRTPRSSSDSFQDESYSNLDPNMMSPRRSNTRTPRPSTDSFQDDSNSNIRIKLSKKHSVDRSSRSSNSELSSQDDSSNRKYSRSASQYTFSDSEFSDVTESTDPDDSSSYNSNNSSNVIIKTRSNSSSKLTPVNSDINITSNDNKQNISINEEINSFGSDMKQNKERISKNKVRDILLNDESRKKFINFIKNSTELLFDDVDEIMHPDILVSRIHLWTECQKYEDVESLFLTKAHVIWQKYLVKDSYEQTNIGEELIEYVRRILWSDEDGTDNKGFLDQKSFRPIRGWIEESLRHSGTVFSELQNDNNFHKKKFSRRRK